MALIYDHISGRYFNKDIHELAIQANELNIKLAYDKEERKRKATKITYNDLMLELFDAPGVSYGDHLTFNMPIIGELFYEILPDGKECVVMYITESLRQETRR